MDKEVASLRKENAKLKDEDKSKMSLQAQIDLLQTKLATSYGRNEVIEDDYRRHREQQVQELLVPENPVFTRRLNIHYIAPTDDLQMPQDVLDYVSSHSNFTQKKFSTLAGGISHVDFVYVTRIQKEQFPSAEG
ncbi:hypothetical protein B9Z55_004786 [Caenorhabditis nigoni]|uniref:Uncharacterized protein n=1 Tax=Caenorhabditis nigoni TaxID=1611254 RepID=A0A2G5UYB4_9PELO|nr:hypothetical protein B9Z55_004783 [Caenorhabditis nigoni]PIC44415.1 hypothetical protein B9Z55_004786 [Caenorhabditis nigoni]